MTKNAKVETMVQSGDGPTKQKSENVEHSIPAEAQPLQYVEVSLGLTEPTKPYGNIRVDVKLGLHVETSEIDAAFEFAKEWIDGKIGAIMEEVQADLAGANG